MNNMMEKIEQILIRSPFGSGRTITEYFLDTIMELGNGVWRLEYDTDTDTVSVSETDGLIYPTWHEAVQCGVEILPDTIRILLGSGKHHAEYVFSRTGDLIDIIPDEIESERFYPSGMDRREWLLKMSTEEPKPKPVQYWELPVLRRRINKRKEVKWA